MKSSGYAIKLKTQEKPEFFEKNFFMKKRDKRNVLWCNYDLRFENLFESDLVLY